MTQRRDPGAPHEDIRANIVNAALRLFGERGYHATSLQEIIQAARCSKGAFYHYFESKEDLLLMLHDTFIDYLLEYAEQMKAEPGPPLERLERICRHLLESMGRFRNHMAVFSNEARFLTQRKFALVQSKRDRYEAAVRFLVNEAIQAGDLRSDVDPRIFTLALLGMYNWAFRWFKPGKPKSAAEMSAVLFALLVEGGKQPMGEPGEGHAAG